MSIETLENKVKKLNADIEQFKELQTNKDDIDWIRSELEEVKDQADTCTELVDEFDVRVTTIEEKIPWIEKDIAKVTSKNSELDAKIEDVKRKIEADENEPEEEIEMYDDSEVKWMIITAEKKIAAAEQKIKTVENKKADRTHTHAIDDIEWLPAFLEDIKNKPTWPVSVWGYTKWVRTITAWSWITIEGDARNPVISAGSGDVVWPASATDGNIALYDWTTGKLIKNSTYSPASFAPALTSDQNYVTDAQLGVIQNTSWTNTGDQDLSWLVPYTWATGDVNLWIYMLLAPTRRATTSAGMLIESANGTDIWLLWAWNTANVTWYGSHNYDTATQDTIAIFTGSWKTLWSAALATYPSLTELAYVKWVTSAIQTQLDAKITASSTDTLTNKRITPRVTSETSSATPTINTDNTDIHRVTGLVANITSMTTNLSWTPTHWQKLIVEVTGTATRTIAWGSSFEASTIALPTTTVSTAMLTVWFMRNSATSKWRCVATA